MSTTERVTVTLSAELLERIDRLERNRSRFIAQAVEHELTRRRRESLLSSVSHPHPETADAADTGLGDWTADLPDEEGLVDVAGGTAVRWVEGQGWVRSPREAVRAWTSINFRMLLSASSPSRSVFQQANGPRSFVK